jgi:hypothetical protein
MVEFVIFVAVFLFTFFEVELVSLNYLCRIKYKQYFKEGEKTKAKLDREGHRVFSVFIFPVVIKSLLLISFISIYYVVDTTLGLCLIWFLLGLIFTNTIVDKMTFEDKMICVKSGCPKVQGPSLCEHCNVHEEYTFSLRLFKDPVIKKKEK